MRGVKWFLVFVEDEYKHKLDISDYSGNVFLANVERACYAKDTSLTKYRCLIFDLRAWSWKAPQGEMAHST
jgi:hypothetical protein